MPGHLWPKYRYFSSWPSGSNVPFRNVLMALVTISCLAHAFFSSWFTWQEPKKMSNIIAPLCFWWFFYRQVEKGLKRETNMSTSYFEINSKLFCVHFIVSYCLVDVNTEESLVDRFVSTTGYCLTWKIWNIVQCSCYSTLLILYTNSIKINYVKDKR